jgi:hypothetical protein
MKRHLRVAFSFPAARGHARETLPIVHGPESLAKSAVRQPVPAMGIGPTGIEIFFQEPTMTNLQNTLFAVALTALTGSALAATPPAAASPTAAAKTTLTTKHKHFAKAKKEDAKSASKKAGNDGGKS